jgi:hypothetical protein
LRTTIPRLQGGESHFFGADPGFTCELFGEHGEVEQKDRRAVDGGQEGLFLEPFKPVIARIFADDDAIFLFNETVVIFLVVP